MEKRTLAALAITFIVLMFYPMILQHYYPEYGKSHKTIASPVGTSVNGAAVMPSSIMNGTASGEVLSEKDVRLANDSIEMLFNEKDGSLRELSFLKFKNILTRKPIKFFSYTTLGHSPTWVELISADGGTLTPDTAGYFLTTDGERSLTASSSSGGVKLTKTYEFASDPYALKMRLRFENTTAAAKEFRYRLYAGSDMPPRDKIDSQYVEANLYEMREGKTHIQHVKATKAGRIIPSQGNVDWAAVKDRHFSLIVKPQDTGLFTGFVEGLSDRHFRAALLSEKVSLAPGASAEKEFLVYLGPTEIDRLEPLGLGAIVNFGKLDGIGRFLVGSLEMIHSIVHNYGLSIILLTLIINLVLFPLTRQSFMSMKRMQLVQPHMNKLRDQHKKNPERLNKETMELYKKHKVNPFGGCLPMLLQMPVFIALYVALSKAVILVNSKFLWIQDLSSPDTVTLPFSLPLLGQHIHILPLLMAGAMFFQQKFGGMKMEGQDPAMESQQKMMGIMMPVIFGFIFYSMPSALVLYWLTNTLMMTAYQLHLKRVTLT